jgi:hypothetical protein
MSHSTLVFIDPNVADYQTLIDAIPADAEVVILDRTRNGLEQITERLKLAENIEAIHIISHGEKGRFKLGQDTIDEQQLEIYRPQLQQWQNSLTQNADILLYGCDIGAFDPPLTPPSKGGELETDSEPPLERGAGGILQKLQEITQADIAASDDLTGFGGDWELETQVGNIETAPITPTNYDYILANPVANADKKAVTGSLTSKQLDVLGNDSGTGRLTVESIGTTGTKGTVTINDWIYVGGQFSSIGGVTRNYIARLNSDGSVDRTFSPNPNNVVSNITLDNSGNPIVSGAFTSIGGQTRNYIARLYRTNGAVDTTFNPSANNYVYAIALDSSGNPIVGGSFTSIGGETRNRIAKLDLTTGAADTTFNPNANSDVRAIALDSSGNPIVGGDFTSIGGETRNRIAKLNPITGAADTTFNPNANGYVYEIALEPIVGGYFNTIGDQTLNRIAKLDPTTGAADTQFNPNANDWVYAIALDSSGNPIVGGSFTSIGGQTRNYIAKLNPTTGAADTTFNPNGNSVVEAIALDSSGNPIVGGSFTSIGGQTRNYIAKLNPSTGAADPKFDPNANEVIRTITIDPKQDILYTPAANFNGVDSFTYTARDRNGVSSSTTVSVLVNDSPVLDNSGSPTLNPQNQNDNNSSGTLISTIIANLGGSKIVDPNTSAKQGIAITNLDTTNGTWQYTTNGTTWNNCPTVSAINALLLASDTNTKIRFVPNTGYTGTIDNAITFAAWDQITGSNGKTADYSADLSTNGTSSVFSNTTETAKITINSAPTITSVKVPTDDNYKIGDVLTFTVNFSQAVTITGSPTLPINLNSGGVVNATLNGTGASATSHNFTYTVAAGDFGTYGITVGKALNLPADATIQNFNRDNAILDLNNVPSTANVFLDGIVPTVTLTSNAADLITDPFKVTATFSESVTGFEAKDIKVANGTVINFTSVDAKTYTFDITPIVNGQVTVDIPANSATDNAGNNNIAANQLTRNPNIILTNISRTGNEDTDIVLTANDFINAFFDIDGDSLSKIKITSLPANGILKLSDAEVTLNQEITAAELNNLTFTPDVNFNGSTSFNWNGFDGNIYADTDAKVNLNIGLIGPTLKTISKSGQPNSQINFAVADFTSAFDDPDNDSLSQIKITSLPSNGILRLNGSEVTVNQEITADQLSNLNFTPNSDFNGNISFNWNGSDGENYADTDALVYVSIGNVKLIQTLFSNDVQENGGFDLYKVKLATQPTADVTINITTDGQTNLSNSGSTSPSSSLMVLFTPSNWDIAQTVIVTAVNDNVQEGLHSSQIIHSLTSSDSEYNNLTVNLTANVSDNDDLGEVFEEDLQPNWAGTNLSDRLMGTAEMNIFHGREGNDFIDGQGGSDRLYGRENDDYILGGDGDDKIWGGQGNDYIEGNADNDLIFGESGSDRLLGGDGSDRLLGHKDNDYLQGDLGADTLTGGQGRDVFAIGLVMGGLTLEEADVITDFNVAEDFIDLMDSATNGGLSSEALNLTQGTGTYANDLIIQHQATGEYLAILQGGQGMEVNLIQFI